MDAAASHERARRAVAVVFAANGLTFASWASRTPAIRDALALSPAGLGLLILCVSAGALVALPLAGGVVGRLGPARTVRIAGLV
ncbi:MAG: major facilitator superfamily 1, partial [Solirubrobacterales bacterium]|nr:major facilitator superfamily 1 [Solirubrobacterales bacterium]